MGREIGTLPISANFEIKKAAPIDDKSKVDTLADLTNASTFIASDGVNYSYIGMIVCVSLDSTPANNGLYVLTAIDYTNPLNWVKIGFDKLNLDQATPQTIIGREIHQDGIQLGTTPTVGSFSAGKVFYDVNNKTISAMIDGDVTLQIGQEEIILCWNNTGSTIPNGATVYLNGAISDLPTIALSKADHSSTSIILGVATQNIPNGTSGLVTKSGIVHDLDTSGFNIGDIVFVSPTVAGGITNILPTSEQYAVIVGYVLNVNATTGSILVKQLANNRLVDLQDIDINNPLIGSVLKWNGLKWVNGDPIEASPSSGTSFFIDNTVIIPANTQNEIVVETLLKTASLGIEHIDNVTVTNSTALIGRYIYNAALGITSINSGAWTFNIYGYVSASAGISTMPISVRKVIAGVGTLTITGTGTTRIATITGGSLFLSGDYNADITIRGLIQTPNGVFNISGYTSSTVCTITTLASYVNESSVVYELHRHLFTDIDTEINNLSVGLIQSQTLQPAFALDITDKLSISIYGKTTSASAKTLYFYHGGNTNYSNFTSPILIQHNELPGLQGGSGSQRYHITSAEAAVVANTSGTNTGDNSANTLYNNLPSTTEKNGFKNPELVVETYSQANRTITLSGTVVAYWQSTVIASLVNGWVSDPHPTGKTVNQYLYYNGTAFVWSDNAWSFDMVQIAATIYLGATIGHVGFRECHGLMDWQSHRDFHFSVGTTYISGGVSSGTTLNSTTAAQRRPDISATVLLDEDLQSTITALTSKTYAHHYLSGSSASPVSNIAIGNADIVPLLTNNPYYNRLNAGTWGQTLVPDNGHMSVYVLAIPVTNDTESQAVRYLFCQGQNVNIGGNTAQNATALANQLALDPAALNIYNLNSPEYRIIWQYVLKYSASNWTIVGEQQISGTKSKPVQTTGTTGLTSVEHDSSLSGAGTIADPLIVNAVGTENNIMVFGATNNISDSGISSTESIGFVLTSTSTDATSGIKINTRLNTPFTISNIIGELYTAATGAIFTIDIKKNGTSIFSTKLTFDSGEDTTTTAATAYVLTNNPTSFAATDKLEVIIDQVGATVAGKGCILYLIGKRK